MKKLLGILLLLGLVSYSFGETTRIKISKDIPLKVSLFEEFSYELVSDTFELGYGGNFKMVNPEVDSFEVILEESHDYIDFYFGECNFRI